MGIYFFLEYAINQMAFGMFLYPRINNTKFTTNHFHRQIQKETSSILFTWVCLFSYLKNTSGRGQPKKFHLLAWHSGFKPEKIHGAPLAIILDHLDQEHKNLQSIQHPPSNSTLNPSLLFTPDLLTRFCAFQNIPYVLCSKHSLISTPCQHKKIAFKSLLIISNYTPY